VAGPPVTGVRSTTCGTSIPEHTRRLTRADGKINVDEWLTPKQWTSGSDQVNTNTYNTNTIAQSYRNMY